MVASPDQNMSRKRPGRSILLHAHVSSELGHQLQSEQASLLLCRAYCRKLSIYRKRAWCCSLTGKAGLTYEEALVSEGVARGDIQQVIQRFRYPATCPASKRAARGPVRNPPFAHASGHSTTAYQQLDSKFQLDPHQ